MFGVYTSGFGSTELTPAQAFSSLSTYFDGSYFTGELPPISFPFFPYTAVVDLDDGKVVAMDTSSSYLSTGDIIDACETAAASK